MNKTNWVTIALLSIVGLLAIPVVGGSLLRPCGGGGWGMMRPGMIAGWGFGPPGWIVGRFALLLPLGLLGLLVLGGMWLFRQVTHLQAPADEARPLPSNRDCPNCQRPVQADWQHCPHCGYSLA